MSDRYWISHPGDKEPAEMNQAGFDKLLEYGRQLLALQAHAEALAVALEDCLERLGEWAPYSEGKIARAALSAYRAEYPKAEV